LIFLLLPKTVYIGRLNKMGLMGRKLNNPDLVHLSFKNELRRLMISSTID
jgi:hypothetical protein